MNTEQPQTETAATGGASDVDRRVRCRKCGHVAEPISTTEPFPTMGVQLDMDDPDYADHRDGIDVDGYLSIGLEVCRSCHALIGFWIENCDDAVFHADWGREREASNKK